MPLNVDIAELTVSCGAVTVMLLAAVTCTCAVGALIVTPLLSMLEPKSDSRR